MSKILITFAGPNGSGKSSTRDRIKHNFDDIPFVNADELAKYDTSAASYHQKNINAAFLAERMRCDYLLQGASFSYETVMSTPSKIAFMDEAKKLGYTLNLFFVATEDPSINIDRVGLGLRMVAIT